MKIYHTIIIAFIGLAHLTPAYGLPEGAKKILEKLAEYEDRELKDLEKEIVKKKKLVIQSLERSEKRIKAEGMRKLYTWQINTLKEEVASSERLISGSDKQEIVDYDVTYHYNHPIEEFSNEKGELIFYSNRKVQMRHKNPQGETQFSHEVSWELRDGKLVILDQVHGEMIVSQKWRGKRNILNIEWTKLRKTITAERK